MLSFEELIAGFLDTEIFRVHLALLFLVELPLLFPQFFAEFLKFLILLIHLEIVESYPRVKIPDFQVKFLMLLLLRQLEIRFHPDHFFQTPPDVFLPLTVAFKARQFFDRRDGLPSLEGLVFAVSIGVLVALAPLDFLLGIHRFMEWFVLHGVLRFFQKFELRLLLLDLHFVEEHRFFEFEGELGLLIRELAHFLVSHGIVFVGFAHFVVNFFP